MATKTQRRKRCRHCDELRPPDEVVDGMCEECEQYHEWCNICREHQHTDSLCRHLFWADWGEYIGAGAYEESWSYCRESFLLVLAKTGLARELRREIEADTLETKYYGPMIGGCSYWCWLHGRTQGAEFGGNVGDRFTRDLSDELEEAMTPGVGWLNSIQYGESKVRDRARALTVQWIDEYLAREAEHVEASAHGLVAISPEFYHWWPTGPVPVLERLGLGYGQAAKDALDKIKRQSGGW